MFSVLTQFCFKFEHNFFSVLNSVLLSLNIIVCFIVFIENSCRTYPGSEFVVATL